MKKLVFLFMLKLIIHWTVKNSSQSYKKINKTKQQYLLQPYVKKIKPKYLDQVFEDVFIRATFKKCKKLCLPFYKIFSENYYLICLNFFLAFHQLQKIWYKFQVMAPLLQLIAFAISDFVKFQLMTSWALSLLTAPLLLIPSKISLTAKFGKKSLELITIMLYFRG